MKKIIDANFFQDPALEVYLKSDKNNMVIFSDYACMETYKGNALKNISKSLSIVEKFSNQVIVLKGTRDVVKITLSEYTLEDLNDIEQTEGFSEFCLHVKQAIKGDEFLAKQLLANGTEATRHFNKVKNDAKKVIEGIKKLIKSFKLEQLHVLRKRQPYGKDLIEKQMNDILWLAVFLFDAHPDVKILPQTNQVRDSFIFRFAICGHLLALKWIRDGGPENVSLEKMRNDVIDIGHVTYATLFDGLLTKDNKMEQIYQEATFLLENLFYV